MTCAFRRHSHSRFFPQWRNSPGGALNSPPSPSPAFVCASSCCSAAWLRCRFYGFSFCSPRIYCWYSQQRLGPDGAPTTLQFRSLTVRRARLLDAAALSTVAAMFASRLLAADSIPGLDSLPFYVSTRLCLPVTCRDASSSRHRAQCSVAARPISAYWLSQALRSFESTDDLSGDAAAVCAQCGGATGSGSILSHRPIGIERSSRPIFEFVQCACMYPARFFPLHTPRAEARLGLHPAQLSAQQRLHRRGFRLDPSRQQPNPSPRRRPLGGLVPPRWLDTWASGETCPLRVRMRECRRANYSSCVLLAPAA